MHLLHLSSRELSSTYWRVKSLHNLFGILLLGRFVYSSQFIYSVIIYISTNYEYLFYTLSYDPILFHCVAQIKIKLKIINLYY